MKNILVIKQRYHQTITKTKMIPFCFITTKTKTISFQKRKRNKNDFIKYE